MIDFDFCSPTKFIFRRDAEMQTGKILAGYGSKKVLVHFGGKSAKKSGLLNRVYDSLKAENIAYVELGGVEPNPKSSLVYKGVELCRTEKVDYILAAGGGSAIDSAKAIALGYGNNCDFWDFFTGKKEPKTVTPLGVIPTLPATGSEASTSAVINYEDGNLKRGLNSQFNRPVFALMNPELTYTLPPYQTACGIVDIMSHVLERYMSMTTGVSLTDRLCEAVLLSVIQNAPVVMKNPCDYDARANLMWAGTLAHNHVVGLGRMGDWCCHPLEHELSALYGVAHGAGLAVVLPAYMKYQYKHNVPLFAQLSKRVWGISYNRDKPEETAVEGIRRMEMFFRSLGMPTSFVELGAKESDIPLLASKVRVNDKGLCGSFNPGSKEDFENIYRLACK